MFLKHPLFQLYLKCIMLYTEIASITNTQICKEQVIIQNNNRFPFRNTHLGLSMLLVTLYNLFPLCLNVVFHGVVCYLFN